MDRASESVLKAFDELVSETLAAQTLEQRAAAAAPAGEQDTPGAILARMVDQGLLAAASHPGSFLRTEAGRLAVAGPLDVTFYTRVGCHLCEEAKAQMTPLLREFRARLHEVDIDMDPVLRSQYDYDVPVIFLGARKVAKHRMDLAQLRCQLIRARSQDTKRSPE